MEFWRGQKYDPHNIYKYECEINRVMCVHTHKNENPKHGLEKKDSDCPN